MGILKENPEELSEEEKRKFARLDIDVTSISIKRVLDINDRFLRKISIGQGAAEKGHERSTGFDITVASEIMAILALSNDFGDLKERFCNL